MILLQQENTGTQWFLKDVMLGVIVVFLFVCLFALVFLLKQILDSSLTLLSPKSRIKTEISQLRVE